VSTDFTAQGYRALIAGLIGLGYAVRGYAEAEPARRDLILRHDLDMSPAYAPELGEIEAALGVTATYFVLVRSELYNPFSPSNAEALRKVLAQGHALGLHLDAALYPGGAVLESGAAGEIEALERFFRVPVATVSFHRPARDWIEKQQERIAGRLCAYGRRFFSDMGYCSDSRGGWHHGDPLAHPAVRDGRALQLLTHPIWWVGERADPATRLDRFLVDRVSAIDRAVADNCAVHTPRRARLSFDRGIG
jgi:hypothetical protein